jgi:hypothetical protein
MIPAIKKKVCQKIKEEKQNQEREGKKKQTEKEKGKSKRITLSSKLSPTNVKINEKKT